MKKILVILGHPKTDSFGGALALAYAEGARQTGAEVREIYLGNLDFDPILHDGYSKVQALEPDLLQSQASIQWAEHLIFVYPNWWGTIPALLKGFFDRVLLSGFAFKYHHNSPRWDKLLSGRTAHLIVTMDTPSWYYRWVFKQPGHNQMKRAILGFCGIRVTRITEFTDVRNSSPQKRTEWLTIARRLGEKA